MTDYKTPPQRITKHDWILFAIIMLIVSSGGWLGGLIEYWMQP